MKLISSKAGDRALRALVAMSESKNSVNLLSTVWGALCSHKTLPRHQQLYWPLIAYTCKKYNQLCMQYLQSLPVMCGVFQELLPVEGCPDMVTGTAYVLSPTLDMEPLWGTAVQRQSVLSSDRLGCAKLWVTARGLPLQGLARASTDEDPSLLRILVATQAPASLYGLTAGEDTKPTLYAQLIGTSKYELVISQQKRMVLR
jgi:hypothetical protein